MAGLMSGWMDADAHEQGLEKELEACLITDFFFLFSYCQKKKNNFLCFCPVVLE